MYHGVREEKGRGGCCLRAIVLGIGCVEKLVECSTSR